MFYIITVVGILVALYFGVRTSLKMDRRLSEINE